MILYFKNGKKKVICCITIWKRCDVNLEHVDVVATQLWSGHVVYTRPNSYV